MYFTRPLQIKRKILTVTLYLLAPSPDLQSQYKYKKPMSFLVSFEFPPYGMIPFCSLAHIHTHTPQLTHVFPVWRGPKLSESKREIRSLGFRLSSRVPVAWSYLLYVCRVRYGTIRFSRRLGCWMLNVGWFGMGWEGKGFLW